MSCRVLIVCEDPAHDEFILKPLVERILKDCGKSAADVQLCWNPRVRGFDDVRRSLEQICLDYSHFDLVLFVVDNDGLDRSARLRHLEATHGPRLICCAAVEEVEAWLLQATSKNWTGLGDRFAVTCLSKRTFLQAFFGRTATPRFWAAGAIC